MFDWRVVVAMVLAIVLWASAFTGIRIGLTGYGAIELATLRYLVASAILVVVALLTRMPLPRWRDWPALFALGGVGFTLYNVALNAGEQSVSAGVASFVISSEVAVIAVLATMLLGERIGRRGWAGVALCLMGVGLIAFTNVGAPVPGQSETEAAGASPLLGALLVFIATLCISLYSVLQKPLFRRYNALQLTTCCIWTGTILLFVMAPHTPGRIAEAAPAATTGCRLYGDIPRHRGLRGMDVCAVEGTGFTRRQPAQHHPDRVAADCRGNTGRAALSAGTGRRRHRAGGCGSDQPRADRTAGIAAK